MKTLIVDWTRHGDRQANRGSGLTDKGRQQIRQMAEATGSQYSVVASGGAERVRESAEIFQHFGRTNQDSSPMILLPPIDLFNADALGKSWRRDRDYAGAIKRTGNKFAGLIQILSPEEFAFFQMTQREGLMQVFKAIECLQNYLPGEFIQARLFGHSPCIEIVAMSCGLEGMDKFQLPEAGMIRFTMQSGELKATLPK